VAGPRAAPRGAAVVADDETGMEERRCAVARVGPALAEVGVGVVARDQRAPVGQPLEPAALARLVAEARRDVVERVDVPGVDPRGRPPPRRAAVDRAEVLALLHDRRRLAAADGEAVARIGEREAAEVLERAAGEAQPPPGAAAVARFEDVRRRRRSEAEARVDEVEERGDRTADPPDRLARQDRHAAPGAPAVPRAEEGASAEGERKVERVERRRAPEGAPAAAVVGARGDAANPELA